MSKITMRDIHRLAQQDCGRQWMIYDSIRLPNDNNTYKLGGGGQYFDETERQWKSCEYLNKILSRASNKYCVYTTYKSNAARVTYETEVYIQFRGRGELVKTLEELSALWEMRKNLRDL